MTYNIDLERLSVEKYKEILKNQTMLPGRRILTQNIDDIFAIITGKGIDTVAQLRKSLSTPKKLSAFASESGISAEYLTVLNREMSSLVQKPVLLSGFPGVDASAIKKLNDSGIKTSKDYYEQNDSAADGLFCLCDLVRINGIGPVAAKAFFDAGYKSACDVARADADEMLTKVTEVNRIKQYYKATLGVKDMQFCIDAAKLLLEFSA